MAQGSRMISSELHTILMCDAIFSALRRMRTSMYSHCKSKDICWKKKGEGNFARAILKDWWNPSDLHTCIKGAADIIECVFQLICFNGWNRLQTASAMDLAMHHMQIPKQKIQEHSYNMNVFFTVQCIYCWITDVKRKFRHWGPGLDYQLPKLACATMFMPSQWIYDMHLACIQV